MAKRKVQSKRPVPYKPQGSWTRLLLALTLVPLIIGFLLIGAWVLDLSIFDDPQSQPLVGTLFILFSFAASNALQKKTNLAIGWFLLTLADLTLLLWVELWAQILALIAGLAGISFLLAAFYRQWKADKEKSKKASKKKPG